jgi:hypothetical protein
MFIPAPRKANCKEDYWISYYSILLHAEKRLNVNG